MPEFHAEGRYSESVGEREGSIFSRGYQVTTWPAAYKAAVEEVCNLDCPMFPRKDVG